MRPRFQAALGSPGPGIRARVGRRLPYAGGDARPAQPPAPDGESLRSLDVVTAVVAVALAVGTVVMLVLPDVQGHIAAPSLDLVLDTVAAFVTGTAALLALTRFLESRATIALFQSGALATLAIANVVAVGGAVVNDSAAADVLAQTGQAQLYVFTAARILAAAMLVFGGLDALAGRSPAHPVRFLALQVAVVIAVAAFFEASASSLPRLLDATVTGTGALARGDADATLFGIVIQLVGAGLTMAAALLSRRLWIRDGSVGDGYIALGLVVASFAQVHEVLFPSIHPIQVASSDALWLGFAIVLLLAINAVARSTFSALRTANEQLVELHETDVERAAFEERARLSRELHDGLAQDLWLAKLKVARLLSLPELGTESASVGAEVESAIDAGLADARQAVMALRFTSDEGSLSDLIRRFVEDFSDRFGLRADFEAEPDLPRLQGRAEAELLRITQESLSNVRRHADATVIRVSLRSQDGRLVLMVRDNGRGFDPNATRDGSFGLAAMRERASIVGGELTIDSRPGDGATIQLSVPLASLALRPGGRARE